MLIVFTLVLMVLSWRASAMVGLLAHELAHAGMGRLVGLPIREIRLGEGRTLIEQRIGAMVVRIGWRWRGGTVRLDPNVAMGKVALSLFIAAGPCANLMLFAALLWVIAADEIDRDWIGLILPAAACQFATLVRTLKPGEHLLFGQRIPNDGAVLLELLSGKSDAAVMPPHRASGFETRGK